MENNEFKKCTKCNELKILNDFNKDRTGRNGIKSECKICHNKRNKEWRNKNKHKISEQDKIYRKSLDRRYRMFNDSKHKSKFKNINFNIELNDIIIPEKCPIFNIQLEFALNKPQDNSPSIDKIIPKLGYVKNNIQIIGNQESGGRTR